MFNSKIGQKLHIICKFKLLINFNNTSFFFPPLIFYLIMHLENWKEDLEMNRKSKDNFFAQNLQSPIPMNERENFDGLKYYPPDPKFYLELDLHEHAKKKQSKFKILKIICEL